MPTVLRQDGYQFFFYANEGAEPPHIHARRAGCVCKYWLGPVEFESNHGFAARELNQIARIIEQNRTALLDAWHEFFDDN